MKKITLSTLKSFIKANSGNLFINVHSDFDGMTDCVQTLKGGFVPATPDKTVSKDSSYYESTLGINGVWLVRGSRDYFSPYEKDGLKGITVSNCCGSFTLAVKN